LEYDDVINKHRNIIYAKRNKILDSEDLHEDIKEMIKHQISGLVSAEFAKEGARGNKEIILKVNEFLGIDAINDKIEVDDVESMKSLEALVSYIEDIALDEFEKLKNEASSAEEYAMLERRIVLSSIDELWMRHIDAMTQLREAVAFE
jgi:preprotein translocase subunit SecA